MSLQELSDDTILGTPEPKTDRSAVAIRDNLSRVESALSEFDKISAGLDDLRSRYPSDLVYDVTTTKGMAAAIEHRAAWRDPRINVEKFRKTAKAPVLALGKDIDARASWITEQLLEGETPIDEQIKAEERRKEEVRQAKVAAEAGRVIAIQEAIAEITMAPMVAAGKTSADILAALTECRATELDAAVFQEMLPQAKAAQENALAKLDFMYRAKLHDESEAAKVAAERAELEELRKAAAERKAKDEAAAIEVARLDRERNAAEQERLNAEAAAKRAEADRVAAEQRAAAQAEHEAKMKAEREAAAEAKRVADEKAQKALAKQRKADDAEKQVRDAAPALMKALVRMLDAFYEDPLDADREGAVQEARQAIAAASGERVPA